MRANTDNELAKSFGAGLDASAPSPTDLTLAANLHKIRLRAVDSIVLANRRWFERMHLESHHFVELGTRLSRAKSVPEIATAYQQWFGQRLSIAALDAEAATAVPSKLVEVGAVLFAQGRKPL